MTVDHLDSLPAAMRAHLNRESRAVFRLMAENDRAVVDITLTPQMGKAFYAIVTERRYQDGQAELNHDDPAPRKSMEEFVLYMEDYMHQLRGELSRTWGADAYKNASHTLRKVVALGVACMEQHGAPPRAIGDKNYTGRKPA